MQLFQKVIKQHLRLYDLVDLIQRTFNVPINGQFFTSYSVVSINIYLLTTFQTLSIHCLSVLLHLMCMLVEFLIYCWAGNEITINHEKFRNSIFLINWTKLNLRSRKGLILIAARTVRPIVMSRNSIMDLSLQTFLKVLKLSYSAFNVVRRAT
ncbi:odorant receptor 2a-like [Trichogramma pretiosum]|uniref:odorant receptor 2a-like n=1 Tax=Trichogramma pretiosum TaxID=7493 RepID=UPI000C71A7F0|nr:odorant receptor 2a-like [Trichogramma pretiosum]